MIDKGETVRLKPLLIVVLGIALGIGIAYSLIPVLFNVLPSDFKRTGLILRTCKTPPEPVKTVLFGNSILMNGVNARLVSQAMGGECVYNFSSTGQTLSEGFLYYQDIPATVRTVVQFVTVDDLTSDDQFSRKTLTNFLMMGYRPDEHTVAVLRQALGDEAVAPFKQNSFVSRFEGRWIVINYINSALRESLRKDLALGHLESELYYPYSYNKKVEPEKLEVLVRKNNPATALHAFVPDQRKLFLLRSAQAFFAKRNTRYVVCVFPVNPLLKNYTEAYFKTMQDSLSGLRTEMPVFDYTHLLSQEEFVDHCHPDKVGAEKMSRVLADNLKAIK